MIDIGKMLPRSAMFLAFNALVALFLALLRIYRRDFKLQPDARV